MKNITLIILCSILLLSCGKQAENNKDKNPFVVDILLKTTPVKDQGQGSLCWAYAMLSTIETNGTAINNYSATNIDNNTSIKSNSSSGIYSSGGTVQIQVC